MALCLSDIDFPAYLLVMYCTNMDRYAYTGDFVTIMISISNIICILQDFVGTFYAKTKVGIVGVRCCCVITPSSCR